MSFTNIQQEGLSKGVEALSLSISQNQEKQIHSYLNALLKWNKVYNLTGFKTFEDNLIKNILDSLAITPFVNTTYNLDLGTGAGLPGLLMAIVKPQQEWILLDSNGKKTRFLEQIKQELSLKNVTVVNERAENFHPDEKMEGISSRAFDKIPSSLELVKHLLDQQSRFYAMKGKLEHEDLNSLPAWASLEANHPIKVPGLNEERHLIVVRCDLTRGN